MSVLDRIKGAFSRKANGQAASPLSTSWIMDRIKLPEMADEKALRPIPLVGHLPYRQQMAILLVALIVAGLLFVLLLYGIYLYTSHYAKMRSASTEMQVLSQRIARSSGSALLGSPEGFFILESSVKKFEDNLGLIENESPMWLSNSAEKVAHLNLIQEKWSENFRPNKDKPNLHSIFRNRDALTAIAKAVSGATANDKDIELLLSVLIHVEPIYNGMVAPSRTGI